MNTITAIVLAKNEEKMIGDCLASVKFANEIILIDSQSTDKTAAIAKEHGAKIFEETSRDFSAKRNLGLQKASGEWVLYIDADERVTERLKESMLQRVNGKGTLPVVFRVKRQNYYLGNNPWPHIEKLERFFKKDALTGWYGALHESPTVKGEVGDLDGYLLHYTHRDLSQMIVKTNQWSETEALLRFDAQHPVMSWWRFPRVMIAAFLNSYIKQGGFRAGTTGLIESMYQSYSIFITYVKLWELQHSSRETKSQKPT